MMMILERKSPDAGSARLAALSRDTIVGEITDLANIVSSIIGYATENLLVEVSKLTRDQLANELVKPDFGHFRVQIFKYLLRYSEFAEQKSRLLSPIFIDIYRNEMHHSSAPKLQNLLLSTAQEDEEDDEEKSAVNPLPQPQNDGNHSVKKLLSKPKDVIAALKALLTLFSKFHSPKTVFREPELREIYFELLLSTDSDLQAGSLACLFTYKEPYLLSYEEHLMNLTNEKKLNDELVVFSVDEQNCAIDSRHRDNLMPYVLRILYGRFHAKSVARGKMKRLAIFRFLANCKANELEIFVRLILEPFFKIFDMESQNIEQILTSIAEKYDPSNTFPLFRIRSVLGIVNDVFSLLAPSLSSPQIGLLFDINLVCGTLVNHGLVRVGEVGSHTANQLKALRVQVFQTFIQFHRSFQLHPIETSRINCLFTAVLEPMILNYNSSLSNSGPLVVQISVVKLFTFWSEFARYFPLLNYQFSEALQGETPISLLCNTLLHAGTPKDVQANIVTALLELLKSESENEQYLFEELPFEGLAQQAVPEHENANGFGSRIVFPQIQKILEFLSVKIPQVAKDKSKIPFNYLDLLNRVSPFVDDKDSGEKFAMTFLSYLGNNRLIRGSERMKGLLSTLSCLSKYISDPIFTLRRVTRLLSKLHDRSSRDALVSFILTLRENSNFPPLSRVYIGILEDLESYDKRRIEELDLERRFRAFERITEILDKKGAEVLPVEVVHLFAHSHAYCLINSTDIALRKTSSNAFRRLIKYISERFESDVAEATVYSHVVPLTLDGLNSSNEICRTEFIYLLADLIARFPKNVHFAQLQVLNKGWQCDEQIDEDEEQAGGPEKDESNFFENAVHIQIYRRQRAFFRLTEQLKSGELNISADILLRYILPIFKPYLLETTPRLSALSDQSIKLFATILERTSWRKYYQFLETFMRQLDDQDKIKGVVRVLVAILGAFRFDVKNAAPSVAAADSAAGDVEQSNDARDAMQTDETHVEEDVEMEPEVEPKQSPADEGQKIVQYMVSKLFPRLRQALQTTELHQNHKKSHQNDFEIDEELLTRAPIVLAMSHVLKQLPDYILKENLNGLIAALNRLLLSRSNGVRHSARKIMASFVQILGSKHLPYVIKELRQTLLRGFQINVMIATVHTSIAALENEMKAGDLDSCFEDIFEICQLELTGDIAEARKNAIPESKLNMSVDTFIFLGKYISEKSMPIALQKVKETIDTRPKGDVIKRLSELLRAFSTGLHRNANIDLKILIEFIHSILQQYLGEMLEQQQRMKSESVEKKMLKMGHRPQSCLLLPPEPKRIGELVKQSLKSKVTIFVEFSLQLLADVLKTRPVAVKNVDEDEDIVGAVVPMEVDENTESFLGQLDKFVALIIDCMKLKLLKVISLSLRCLSILLKYKLPSIQNNIQTIMDRMFVTLSEYVGIGQNNPAVSELNHLLFKCFTQLIRDFPILSITPRRVEILLNYAESDLLDSQKQATSFSLIKAIVARKIEDEKVDNLIQYLAELSITSLSTQTRAQCRQVILMYLTSHPSGTKKLDHWLEFFANQTEYEFETGRLSALEMLNSIFESCSQEGIDQLSLFVFMRLSSRLVNDESEECQKYVSLVLQNILSKVHESSFNDLFLVAKDWLNSKKSSVQLLALKVFRNFVYAQSKCANENVANISAKLYEIAEILVGNLTSAGASIFEEWSETVIVASFDYLNSFCDCNPLKLNQILSNIAESIAVLFGVLNDALRCISSPNVQLASANFLGRLFTIPSMTADDDSSFNPTEALAAHFPRSLIGVCLAVCAQIRHLEFRTQTLADQATKNLSIVMSKLNAEDFDNICTRLAGICWREISKESDSMMKRENVFKVAAACVIKADGAKMESLCSKLLPLLYREMSRKSDKFTEELHQISTEVMSVFRSKIGEKRLSEHFVKCQKDAFKRVKERKEKLKAHAVLDPAAEARSRQKRHERKRLAKRRKLDEMRPYRVAKRRRREELAAE